MKKLQKTDVFFILVMVGILIMHLMCIFGADHFADESFYPTIPLRLINGDSLVEDEWHLTQFSSIFIYIPVRIFLAVKGSTEGIIVFLRFFYLAIHTVASVCLYAFFRKQKGWAVVAASFYYSQVPLRFMSANYHSVLALSLLIMTMCLLALYENDKLHLYLLAGVCYGCCCVCNPFECLVFLIYIALCITWSFKSKEKAKAKGKNKNTKEYELNKIKERFFGKNAFFKFTAGVAITAVVCILFFFATGGKISSLIENIPNLLNDGSHNIFASPFVAFAKKLLLTAGHINTVSLGMPFILPIFYIALLIDKKRNENSHRIVYVVLSVILSVFFIISVTLGALECSRCLAIALPFAILSTTIYILTQNKNKKLFYCMWLPSAIATIVQYLASDMHLSVMWGLIIGNIAGIFFIKDFLTELKRSTDTKEEKHKNLYKPCFALLTIGICLQLVFQCTVYVIGRTVKSDYTQLESGPYAGLMLDKSDADRTAAMLQDMDLIKEMTDEDDPVLVISEFSWMYLYLERPFATYSAWQPYSETHRLQKYFRMNPSKTPRYIYVGWIYIPRGVSAGHTIDKERATNTVNNLLNLYDCNVRELSCGYLLSVED